MKALKTIQAASQGRRKEGRAGSHSKKKKPKPSTQLGLRPDRKTALTQTHKNVNFRPSSM